MPADKDFIENLMPKATAKKLAVFEQHGVEALVLPYVPTFAQSIYAIYDRGICEVRSPVQATTSGNTFVGFPSSSRRWASGPKACP